MRVIVFALTLLMQQVTGVPNSLVTRASNTFANKFYQEIAKKPGNVLVCPISVHLALALLREGATGKTFEELNSVLELSNYRGEAKEDFKNVLNSFQDKVLTIVTKLYPASDFDLAGNYKNVAKQYFFSDIEKIDYHNTADAAKTINTFVEEKTNNKIHNLITPDSLNDLTRLVIVNAAHFKANWKKTFSSTYEGDFKVTPHQKVKTMFMHQTEFFPYKDDNELGAKVLSMEYEDGGYSMVFVLPYKEEGLPEVEAKLANKPIEDLLKGLRESRVEVTIPKFKLEQTMKLPETLKSMGLSEIFSPKAELRNIASGRENLYVSDVIQKTYINVDEHGTEAAAATGAFIETLMAPQEDLAFFKANRPFHFYLIRTARQNHYLFSGRLAQPTDSEGWTAESGNLSPFEGDVNHHREPARPPHHNPQGDVKPQQSHRESARPPHNNYDTPTFQTDKNQFNNPGAVDGNVQQPFGSQTGPHSHGRPERPETFLTNGPPQCKETCVFFICYGC